MSLRGALNSQGRKETEIVLKDIRKQDIFSILKHRLQWWRYKRQRILSNTRSYPSQRKILIYMPQIRKALMILWFQMLALQSHETIKFCDLNQKKIKKTGKKQNKNQKHKTKRNKTKWTACPCFKGLIICPLKKLLTRDFILIQCSTSWWEESLVSVA